jgi:hypothetical protein
MFLAALVAVALSYPAAAHADVLIFNAPFAASPIDPIDVTPFDASLGTLDSVRVTINGVLIVTGQTPQHGTVDPLAGFIPLPYQYRVDVAQDFDGLGATFFDFSTPATFMLPGVASGVPSPFTLATPFTYGLEFDSTTDLIGFDFPTVSGVTIPPLGGVVGPLNAFIDTGALLNAIVLAHTATPVALGGPLPLVFSVGASGLLSLEYTYTPLTAVPEPASLTLVTGGLFAALAVRRRRRTTEPTR